MLKLIVMSDIHMLPPAKIEYGIDTDTPMVDENGFVQGYNDIKGHRIIMLDSSEPGHDDGILCKKRLNWLSQRLIEAKALNLKVIIIMHHHIRQMFLNHLDEIKLKQADDFEQTLRNSSANIAQIISGHCHITSAGSWRGFPIATLSGNQLRNDINLKNGQQKVKPFESFGQFAVLHADQDGVTVHYHNYSENNIQIATD